MYRGIMDQRLAQQIDFVMELDRLKSVIRQIKPRALAPKNTAGTAGIWR